MSQQTAVRTTPLTGQDAPHSWVPYVAVTAGAMLLLESSLVIGTKATIADAPMMALVDVGLLLAVAAAIGTGLRQRRGRRAMVAVGLVLAIAAWVVAVGDLLTPVFDVFSKEEYVNDEGPFGLLGIALLVLGTLGTWRPRRTTG